jgi:hypothetical protein
MAKCGNGMWIFWIEGKTGRKVCKAAMPPKLLAAAAGWKQNRIKQQFAPICARLVTDVQTLNKCLMKSCILQSVGGCMAAALLRQLQTVSNSRAASTT